MKEVDWRKTINNLVGPFPEKGTEAPSLETSEDLNGEQVGDFSKVVSEVYFFVDDKTGKTYSMQNHWMVEFGDDVTLNDAIEYVKRSKQRKG